MLLSVLTRKFLIGTVAIAAFYILLNVYFTNYSLINQAYFGDFPVSYKFEISLALIQGLTTAMSLSSLLILIIIGLLTGANLMLSYKRIRYSFAKRSSHWAFGLGTLFGTAGGGCASCGLPLLGLLGMSGSVGYLPFKGAEVSVLAIGLLLFSFFVLLKQSVTACVIAK